MKKTIFTIIGLMILRLLSGQEQAEILDQILQRLGEIQSASYNSKSSSSAPGDTLVFSTYEQHINMYINPKDTFLGASFTTSSIDDMNEYDLCYDGNFNVRFDWTNRNAQIDTLTLNPYGRPMAPFFIKVKSLIQYTKDHIDGSTISYSDFNDSIRINIRFKDEIVEFVWLEPIARKSTGNDSRYEIVIDKDFLPFKLVRRMPHQTSWETCTDIETSNQLYFDFSSIQQIPADFQINETERGISMAFKLEGEKAPDWKLKEIYGDSLTLSELKHKVILIQFTGIGCGPCHASISFLRTIANDNKDKDFELISIETWSNNIAGIERYKDLNELNYTFLVSNNEIKEKYKIQGVPSFFILDEKRVIRKVYIGYQQGASDKEIMETINALL